MRRNLFLASLGVLFGMGGTSPVKAATPVAITESEKAWGADYPKLHPMILTKTAAFTLGSIDTALDGRNRLHVLANDGYMRDRFENRRETGFAVDDPYTPGANADSVAMVLGTDGIPRAFYTAFETPLPRRFRLFATILGEDPSQWSAQRISIPVPSHGAAAEENRLVFADATPDGKIHIAWSHRDTYGGTDPPPPENRIFYARISQGPPLTVDFIEEVYTASEPEFSISLCVAVAGIEADPVSGVVHILWGEDTEASPVSLRHASRSGTWSGPATIGALDFTPGFSFNAPADLALDSTGAPGCVFVGPAGLAYARNAGAGWAVQMVPEGGTLGIGFNRPALGFDSRDRALVAYNNGTGVFMRRREAAGGFSNAVPVGVRDEAHDYLSIAVSGNDGFWVTSAGIVDDPNLQFRRVLTTHVQEDNLGFQDAYAMLPDGRGSMLNAANGNQVFSLPLFSTQGRGLSHSLSILYNSGENEGDLGLSPGWCHSAQTYLTETVIPALAHQPGSPPTPDKPQVTLHQADGSRVVFDGTGSGPFLAKDKYGFFSRLERSLFVGDTPYPWVMTDKLGIKYGFGFVVGVNQPGNPLKLRRIRDTNGNEMNYTYGDNPLTAGVTETNLLTMTDSVGRVVTFRSNADNQVDRITYEPTGRFWTLSYDPATKKLSSVEDSASIPGGTWKWQFQYHAVNDFPTRARKGLLSAVIPPKGLLHAWRYGYQGDNRVVEAKDPDQKLITVQYVDKDPSGNALPVPGARVYDRKANAEGADNPTSVSCDFARSLALRITLPQADDGAVPIVRTFDGFRNELTFQDARGNTTIKTYAATAVPAYVKDNLETVQRPGNDLAHVLRMTYTQDGKNRLETLTQERRVGGSLLTTTMGYDAAGNLRDKTYPDGATEHTDVDAFGRITSFRDARLHTTVYGYGGMDAGTGLPTSITRPGDATPETYEYNVRGLQTKHTTIAGGVYVSEHDLRDRLTASVEPVTPDLGAAPRTEMKYDLHDLLEEMKDPKSHLTRYTYDLLDRQDEMRNALWTSGSLNRIKQTYDPNGNVLTRSDLKNRFTAMEYDARNRVTKETAPDPGTGDPIPQTLYAYDGSSNLKVLTRKGSPDQVTTLDYDGRNNLLATQHPPAMDFDPTAGSSEFLAAHLDETGYDESDLPTLRMRTSNGAFVSASGTDYNRRNLPSETREYRTEPTFTSADSYISTGMIYDPATNLEARTDPDQRTWRFAFDPKNRPTTSKDAKGVIVSETKYFDAANKVETWVSDPSPTATSDQRVLSSRKTFNKRGQLESVEDNFGKVSRNRYDAAGNLKQSQDAAGNRVDQDYDALDRLKTTTVYPAKGRALVTSYVLDENGNRTETLDSLGRLWKTEFDALNRPVKSTNPPPSLSFRTTKYDAFGNMRESLDEQGQLKATLHDSLNRPMQVSISGGGVPSQTLVFRHDGGDRRTLEQALQGEGSQVVRAFDALSRERVHQDFALIAGNQIHLSTLSYEYSDAGDRTSCSSDDPNVGLWTYQHDENHLLTALTDSFAQGHGWTYDHGQRQKTHAMPNGCVETRGYDAKERLASMVTRTSGGAVLCDLGYAFDDVDNRTSITYGHLGGAVQGFLYDGQYRLTHESLTGGSVTPYEACYGYDDAGNRVLKTVNGTSTLSAYDPENRLTAEATVTGFALVAGGTASADSGTNAAAITDGSTTDSPTSGWMSANTAVAHTATLDYGAAPKLLGRIKVFLPTLPGPVQRFKVQAWDLNALAFQDLPFTLATGAVPSASEGWWTQTAHEITLECFLVSTTRIRFLQDAGGGPLATPNQAIVNELQAFEAAQGSTRSLAYSPAGLLVQESAQGGLANFPPGRSGPGPHPGGASGLGHQMKGQPKPNKGGVPALAAQGGAQLTDYSYDWGYRLANYSSGGVNAHYTADVLGRRMLKTVGTSSERYVLDGEDVIADYSAASGGLGAMLARYTNGEGIDNKLSITRGGSSYQYVADALGSTQQLLSSTQGVSNRYLNTAWGESLNKTEAVTNRYQYTGREFSPESSTYFYRARTYFQGRGGFGQRDPGFSGGNWMAYVDGNAANTVDPLGLNGDPKRKADWLHKSLGIIGVSKVPTEPDDILKMNAKIRGAYAAMYLRNPDLDWAGMAAYATNAVRNAMTDAIKETQHPSAIRRSLGRDILQMLAEGNFNIYRDMYWQALAYESGGIHTIDALLGKGVLSWQAYTNWVVFDYARKHRDDKAAEAQFSQAAYMMILTEQDKPLQPVFEQHPNQINIFAGLAAKSPWNLNNTFKKYSDEATMNGKSLFYSRLMDRMKWFRTTIPEWRAAKRSDAGGVRKNMEAWIEDARSADKK